MQGLVQSGPEQVFRYRAFISYRHTDKAWGDWLHKALESYRVPRELVGSMGGHGAVPARLGRVFRDREELAAGDLSEEIDRALRASEHLVVICSPPAARSPWVNEEILAWKRLGREERLFAILIDKGHQDTGFKMLLASTLMTLGVLDRRDGHAERARESYRRAYEIAKAVMPPDP